MLTRDSFLPKSVLSMRVVSVWCWKESIEVRLIVEVVLAFDMSYQTSIQQVSAVA